MAMLQKQQAEQAQRHADAVAKKAKPKQPPKPRTDNDGPLEAPVGSADDEPIAALEKRETTDTTSRKSIESTRRSIDESPLARQPLPNRRKSTRGLENDGNEADLSGAGDTTEGPEDLTERDDSDAPSQPLARVPSVPASHRPSTSQTQEGPNHDTARRESADLPQAINKDPAEEGDIDEQVEEEDIDPELRRKEELRARMAKMSGGMGMGMIGMHGMLGMPPPTAPVTKKKIPVPPERRLSQHNQDAPTSPRGAPPVPTMMALPGMGQPAAPAEMISEADEAGVEDTTPIPAASPQASTTSERPAPPPVPTGPRPPPPPVPAGVKSPSVGSESDDELSEGQQEPSRDDTTLGSRAPPPPVPAAAPLLPTSPRDEELAGDELSPTSPSMPSLPPRRHSKPPPPIPGAALPVLGQARPPPPPPPGHASRPSMSEGTVPTPMQPGHLDNGEETGTDYEGDYDTDIASSAPHKEALKTHARQDSSDGHNIAQSPPSLPPPVPGAAAPRAVPPPVPSQLASPSRRSMDVPRAAPPPPPPGRGASFSNYTDEDYDPFNYNAAQRAQAELSQTSVSPRLEDGPQFSEPSTTYEAPPLLPPAGRAPPPAPPQAGPPPTRGSARQSLDIPRQSMGVRRSVDSPRPPAATGFFANDIDLAEHSKWWLTPNGVPPVFQGRKDILVETQESTSSGPAGAVSVNKVVKIVFQDYSQTVITVEFDPQDASSGELDQQHEAPPRTLRQDELERAYETYGMQIAQVMSGKKDSVVGDGTPHGLIHELLKAYPEALRPVGTRAFGALVYSNIGNAATQTNDEIRPGDIVSIRNARFQGKHGPMHAKYSMEVGKPDHVAIVSEWDGTKKKVKAWEQGRENKKLKQESFRLDDLRSGEVKIWRVMPKSWIGWETTPN
ncbi:myosin tail region-interacting protein MTI1 [Microdochium nivale]|nr:myosin tail region-interacting protein MTI1 [Microdochium nivale]